jgi:hypothetical protein
MSTTTVAPLAGVSGRRALATAGAAYVLAWLLVIGGAAFVVDSDALSAVHAASLVLLLLWVGAVTYAVTRGGRLRPPRGVAA